METKGPVGGREAERSATDNGKGVSGYPPSSFCLLTGFRDRNWLEFLAILDATFSAEGNTTELVESTRKFFTEIAERDGKKDRSGPLALLELEKRVVERSISKGISNTRPHLLFILSIVEDPEVLENYLKSYFDQFGDKACCFEDLKPYIVLDGESLAEWTSHLRETTISTVIKPVCPRRL